MKRASSRTPIQTGRMERFLKANGVTVKAYKTWTGGQGLKDFAPSNLLWSQRDWEDLILENLEALRENDQQVEG